jgi:hypothetical protein
MSPVPMYKYTHQNYLFTLIQATFCILNIQKPRLYYPINLNLRRCDDLPATIKHVPVAAALVLNNPDDGRLHPKHVD